MGVRVLPSELYPGEETRRSAACGLCWLREPRLADLCREAQSDHDSHCRPFKPSSTATEDGPEGRRRGGRTTERSEGVSLRSVGDDVYRNVQFARRTGKESADIGG